MNVFTLSTEAAKITDWITAVAAVIGIPLSMIAFIKLIRRDKDKQDQIDKLATMAGILDNQTSEMRKHNELVAMQVEILRESSVNNGHDKDSQKKLQEIEEKKLRLSVQPRLWLNGAGYTGYTGEWYFDLNNKGEVAYIDAIDLLSGDIVLHPLSFPFELEKGAQRNIRGKDNGTKHIKDSEFEIEILYHNTLGQPYHGIVKGIGANAKLILDEQLPQ